MSEPADLFARMMAQGQAMAESVNPALANFRLDEADRGVPTMPRDFMEMMWGNTFNPEGLDARTRLLVVLAGLTALGAQAEPQVRLVVRHALAAGASQREIAETIWQTGMVGGLPAMNKALALAREVFDEGVGDTEGGA